MSEKWKTIKTKPKDDADVLVYYGDSGGNMRVHNWCKKEREWQEGYYNIAGRRFGGAEPTHWMSLPLPPKEDKNNPTKSEDKENPLENMSWDELNKTI